MIEKTEHFFLWKKIVELNDDTCCRNSILKQCKINSGKLKQTKATNAPIMLLYKGEYENCFTCSCNSFQLQRTNV